MSIKGLGLSLNPFNHFIFILRDKTNNKAGENVTLYQAFTQRIIEKMYWKPGEPLIVAVSGGVDSIVLFDLLSHLPEKIKPKLIIAHVNHHLRSESLEEEAFIRRIADQAHTPVYVHQWPKETHPNKGIEKAARDVRYNFFAEIAEKEKSRYILTAHHKDDQVETVLMKGVRGGALEELKGIPEMRKLRETFVLRPLLPFSKESLINHAKKQNLTWKEDESNHSLEFTRNRFRNKILPLLREENPAIENHILSFSEEIADLLDLLAPLIKEKREETIELTDEEIRIKLPDFMLLDKPMRKRVLNDAFLKWKFSESYIIKQTHLDLIIDWLEKSLPHSTFDLPDHLIAERVYDDCVIKKKQNKDCPLSSLEDEEIVINKLDKWFFLNENEKIGLFTPPVYQKERTGDAQVIFLNKDDLSFPLIARHRQDGDRLTIKGLNGSKKVKDIFIDQKILMSERNRAWLIQDQTDKIIWMINYKESALSLDPLTDTISYILMYQKL